MGQLPKAGIKLIDLRSAGYDNVDLEAAANNKIKVMRVPAYSPQAIAEHATALILTLDRKTHKAYTGFGKIIFSSKSNGFNYLEKQLEL
jgi:D-lactate dehydrogenase